jgi:hypothetical protein
MTYAQAQTLKPWIENSTLRAQAKNAFDKDFFKVCNNSVFGKTMQNVRAEACYEFFTNDDKLKQRLAHPRSERCTFIGNIAGVSWIKDDVMLSKPIFTGASILDLSKLLMLSFHYDVVREKYDDKSKLLFTDTDYLCYHIETPDVYADMGQMASHFDTNDYPEEHPLYYKVRKKVVWKVKDETNGVPTSEYVGLKSKMYCFTVGDRTKRTAKGIKKAVAKRELMLQQYKEALGGKACTVKQTMIQSRNHRVCMVSATKNALSGYDTKSWICGVTQHNTSLGLVTQKVEGWKPPRCPSIPTCLANNDGPSSEDHCPHEHRRDGNHMPDVSNSHVCRDRALFFRSLRINTSSLSVTLHCMHSFLFL